MATQRKGLWAAYVVSSTSLQRTQPPTVRAAPKVGPGSQDYRGTKGIAVRRGQLGP